MDKKEEMAMQNIVKFQTMKNRKNSEKLRDIYKKDFQSFVEKRDRQNNTIHFRDLDERKRM